ncbi:HAMP domain-containing sensor histidine kinase [Exiguobacterium sp. SL-9]|uniref:HAMP domain-containing sensor histidine kinase n=1 Tax=Exiguobacterium sp. SL-9 TaxID=2510963 RepID=UPI00103A74FC|nr:HAMP domain-containing sensor histidine kinase [Exiguobacterium sp. SL-9]TCI21084.1 HAMP domain-containing histidine kinase [Exiguobacterium sp. SL-9]
MSRLMKKLLWTAILPLVVMALLTFGLTSLLIGRFAETESYDQLEREADIVYEALVDGRGIPGQLDVLVFQDGEAVNLDRGGRMRRHMTPVLDPDSLSERDEVSANGSRLLTFLREEGDVQIVTYAPVPLSTPQFRQIYVILGSGFLLALLVAIGVTYWMGLRLTSPLIKLKQATTAIMSGRHDIALPPVTDDEIGDLTEAVRQMNTSLEEKERLQNTFISGVTHDVRTPLAIVRNEAEMLELGVVKQEDVAATGRSLTEEVDRIDRLVSQMLEYSKLSAGKLALTMGSVHVSQLIEETVLRMDDWFLQKEVAVVLELEDVTIQADRLAMERVLSNFLQNAYHASPIGGVITIRLSERRLEIEDEGPGIAETMRANIWDMYVKGDRSNGHGLGLAINKLLLEAHQLTYGVESNEGAIFWIEWD